MGAGPAGLFAALLLARNPRTRRVEILEARAQPQRGWGIVLSPRTLETLSAADPRTVSLIRRTACSWAHLRVRGLGSTELFAGHGYIAVPRQTLLGALEQRLGELGVPVRRGQAVTRSPHGDLVVGADGAHSAMRASTGLAADVAVSSSRHFWFGTTRRYDSHCFAFVRRGPHGYVAHAYPHAPGRGTFIVECGDAAWECAGLGSRDPAVACRELFNEELRDARLLPGDQRWARFETVRLARWSSGRLVLIGDAAHTTHFSIGSGTKLALEDAIALDAALRAHPLVDALDAYEAARRPVVERMQTAAEGSQAFFASLDQETAAAWEVLVLRLMTRSGRVRYADLVANSPAFADRLTRRLAPSAGLPAPDGRAPSALPVRLGAHMLPSRIARLVRNDAAPGLRGGETGLTVRDLRGGGQAVIGRAPAAPIGSERPFAVLMRADQLQRVDGFEADPPAMVAIEADSPLTPGMLHCWRALASGAAQALAIRRDAPHSDAEHAAIIDALASQGVPRPWRLALDVPDIDTANLMIARGDADLVALLSGG